MSWDEDGFDDCEWYESGGHDDDCDCVECSLERDLNECGLLPDHLGGGCTMAGTEFCDFECRIRQMEEEEADL